MTHSPEPWEHKKRTGEIHDSAGCHIVCVCGFYDDDSGELVPPLREEDARRIVACVNACRGIPTKRLEKLNTPGNIHCDYCGISHTLKSMQS